MLIININIDKQADISIRPPFQHRQGGFNIAKIVLSVVESLALTLKTFWKLFWQTFYFIRSKFIWGRFGFDGAIDGSKLQAGELFSDINEQKIINGNVINVPASAFNRQAALAA